MSTGLLLASVSVGLGLPLASVEARAFSYLWDRGTKITEDTGISRPQNSQTMAFLEAATNVDPNPAKGGGDITVINDSALLPDVGPSGTIADIESDERQGRVSLYVVRAGDSLPQIAKMFGVSVNTILWANDLEKGSSVRAGQTLVILPINGVQHTVKNGDTIRSIAKKYKGDAEEILAFNDLGLDHVLSVGDVIIIPDGEEVSSVAPRAASASSAKKTTTNTPSYAGYYTNPLPEGHKTQGIHGYNGVDIGAPTGTPIYAAAGGTVIVSRFRTLEISAAGKHNLAMWGPPGTGKTMLAQAFSHLLPELSQEEMLEVTGIHSVSGTLKGEVVALPPTSCATSYRIIPVSHWWRSNPKTRRNNTRASWRTLPR